MIDVLFLTIEDDQYLIMKYSLEGRCYLWVWRKNALKGSFCAILFFPAFGIIPAFRIMTVFIALSPRLSLSPNTDVTVGHAQLSNN